MEITEEENGTENSSSKNHRIFKSMVTEKIFVIFAVFSILMAIPMVMRDALGMTGAKYAWEKTGDIFTDWSIYYLDFIPVWMVISIVAMTGKITAFRLTKYITFFMLGYWLWYDWAWWTIVAIVRPASFSFTTTFYFDILVPSTPMWLFLLISMVGVFLSILLARHAETLLDCLPFVVYLFLVYGIGGIALVMPVPLVGFVLWDSVLSGLFALMAAYSYHCHPGRIEKLLELGSIDGQFDLNDAILWDM